MNRQNNETDLTGLVIMIIVFTITLLVTLFSV
jgi:hypothetical protein